jgi:hypothetical protein
MHTISVVCSITLLLFFLISPGRAEESRAGMRTKETIEQAILMQQEAQGEIEAWNSEKEELLSQIRNLKNQLRSVRYQQEKHISYSAKQEESIRRIEAKQAGLKQMQRELEPYLNEVLERLRRLVQSDLPFLPEERKKRLAFIEESLGDYHLTASEKFRRVLEALQVEAEYGRYPEVDEAFLDLDGELTKVRILRLGRLALYYLTLDGQKAGRYDAKNGRWEQLPKGSVVEVNSAMQMVGKSRSMELVNLPISH